MRFFTSSLALYCILLVGWQRVHVISQRACSECERRLQIWKMDRSVVICVYMRKGQMKNGEPLKGEWRQKKRVWHNGKFVTDGWVLRNERERTIWDWSVSSWKRRSKQFHLLEKQLLFCLLANKHQVLWSCNTKPCFYYLQQRHTVIIKMGKEIWVRVDLLSGLL